MYAFSSHFNHTGYFTFVNTVIEIMQRVTKTVIMVANELERVAK